MQKLERLLNLTAVLLDTRRALTAEEIRGRVEGYPPPGTAFHRAFERDKEDLRVLGIPLLVERAPATDPPVDGYRIDPDDYYLPDPDLDADELAALHLASLTVHLDGMGDREALWKLGGLVGADGPVDAQNVASLPSDPALVPLFKAIVDRRQVSFSYRNAERSVDPWRLDFERGRWYLTGFDHFRNDERNFRLDRIEGAVTAVGVIDKTSQRRNATGTGPRPAWELGDEAPTIAKVRIDADQVEAARRQLGSETVPVIEADGSALFEVPVVNFPAFRSFLFGFLHRAELVEPPEWRTEIVDWLEAIESGR
ncbi:MAG: WYL domain-containing protein [Actinomycetia bacterium]|nr:WYL domain-containing protein [Actinomycetes bacterium]MCP4226498.1 WYL domain-containing protein [Actinomycetes bacterium]MCP5033462.1 WYL domain-containing protein [Actinomycetes bacterium]